MVFVLIVGGALLVLGVLAYAVSQWPDPVRSKKKKEKKEPAAPVVSEKDVAEMAARFERRIRTLENSLQTAEKEHKDKDKQTQELKAVIGGLERQVEQEKAWREKEEVAVVKEKKLEQELRAEINKTRDALHEQSNLRIRLEYEVKELRLVKEALSADVRKFTGQNNELERRVQDFIRETRELKAENAKLSYKKEADQWVAKDDYLAVERMLKAARADVEQLKQRLPSELRDVEEKGENT
jgi:predicted Rdx family selenoprotein